MIAPFSPEYERKVQEWEAVKVKGLATGAEKVFVSDLKNEFVEDKCAAWAM